MRILFISPFMRRLRRGIERFTAELASQLAAHGHDVHIVTWPDPNKYAWPSAHPDIVWHQLPLTRFYQSRCAGHLYPRLFQTLQPDVILLSFLWHGEAAALRRWSLAQTVLVLNYPAQQVRHRYQQMQQDGQQVDKIVAVSHFVAKGAEPYLGHINTVIPNGVDTEMFRPNSNRCAARKQLGLPAHGKVIATVAALEARKGIQHMLAALPAIVAEQPDTHYVIAGEGSFRPQIERQIASLGLQQHVTLTGALDDARAVYAAADLFAFLTRGEACPLALLEAQACGLPLLLAQQEPLPEFADAAGARFVCESDAAAVAASAIALLNDADYAAMCAHNRRKALARFSWQKIGDQYDTLLRELAGQRQSTHHD